MSTNFISATVKNKSLRIWDLWLVCFHHWLSTHSSSACLHFLLDVVTNDAITSFFSKFSAWITATSTFAGMSSMYLTEITSTCSLGFTTMLLRRVPGALWWQCHQHPNMFFQVIDLCFLIPLTSFHIIHSSICGSHELEQQILKIRLCPW